MQPHNMQNLEQISGTQRSSERQDDKADRKTELLLEMRAEFANLRGSPNYHAMKIIRNIATRACSLKSEVRGPSSGYARVAELICRREALEIKDSFRRLNNLMDRAAALPPNSIFGWTICRESQAFMSDYLFVQGAFDLHNRLSRDTPGMRGEVRVWRRPHLD